MVLDVAYVARTLRWGRGEASSVSCRRGVCAAGWFAGWGVSSPVGVSLSSQAESRTESVPTLYFQMSARQAAGLGHDLWGERPVEFVQFSEISVVCLENDPL